MKTAFGEYRRLARSALGFSSLWMGEDHLLYVKGSGVLLPFSEEYRRFRFRDIQSITMARSSGLMLGAIGYLIALLAVGGIGFAFLYNREPGELPLLVVTLVGPLPLCVLLLFLLIRHLVLGPRCVFTLQTALKRESIDTVNRAAKGREIMAQLGEKIRDAQQDLVPAREAPDGLPQRKSKLPSMQVPKLAPFSFAGQAAVGLLLVLLLHLSGLVLAGLALIAAVLSGTPLLISLAAAARNPTPSSVRQLLWWQLVAHVLLGVVATIFYIDQAINDPALTVDALGPIRAFAEISALGGFIFYLIFLVIALAQLFIGITGFLQVRQWEQNLEDTENPCPPTSNSSTPTPPNVPTE